MRQSAQKKKAPHTASSDLPESSESAASVAAPSAAIHPPTAPASPPQFPPAPECFAPSTQQSPAQRYVSDNSDSAQPPYLRHRAPPGKGAQFPPWNRS